MSFNYIDLYAGTSALSEGFKRQGLNPVAHVEANHDACLTITTRVAYYYLKSRSKLNLYHDYLLGRRTRESLYTDLPQRHRDSVIHQKISTRTIDNIFSRIEANIDQRQTRGIDLIVGGPPCQAYSRRHRHGIDWETDDRLSMYLDYGKFLKHFEPKMFVFENVPGFLDAKDGTYYRNLKKYFRRLNYEIDDQVLNAREFGVLQERKRVFIVGWRKDLNLSFPALTRVEHEFTTRAIFGDLHKLSPGDGLAHERYLTTSSEYLDRFGLRNGINYYTQHIARPHNANDRAIYRLVIERWNADRRRLKYSEIPRELRTQANTSSFLDRYKVVDPDGYAHTVIAHIAKDGHHYIHPDLAQCRSISVREAARLQSFPDDFYFEGSRTSAFRQIGNAVPPLLSEALAKAIKKQLPKT